MQPFSFHKKTPCGIVNTNHYTMSDEKKFKKMTNLVSKPLALGDPKHAKYTRLLLKSLSPHTYKEILPCVFLLSKNIRRNGRKRFQFRVGISAGSLFLFFHGSEEVFQNFDVRSIESVTITCSNVCKV